MLDLRTAVCLRANTVYFVGLTVPEQGVQVAATLLAVRPLDPLFHFPLNQLVGIGYVASSLTFLALAVSLSLPALPCSNQGAGDW